MREIKQMSNVEPVSLKILYNNSMDNHKTLPVSWLELIIKAGKYIYIAFPLTKICVQRTLILMYGKTNLRNTVVQKKNKDSVCFEVFCC